MLQLPCDRFAELVSGSLVFYDEAPWSRTCGRRGAAVDSLDAEDMQVAAASFSGNNSGGLAGFLESGGISGCSFTGTVSHTFYGGGMTGRATTVAVVGCSFDGTTLRLRHLMLVAECRIF